MNDILYVLGAVVVMAVAASHYWLKWSEKSDMDKQSYIHDLVMAAEQIYDSDEGKAKLDYVFGEVKARWPSFPESIVRNLIEAAVYRIKADAG